MINLKSIFERISGFSTPLFGVSWHASSAEGLKRRLLHLDKIVESYSSIRSGIWLAESHFKAQQLTKDESITYIRPLTTKAAETRDYIKAHQFEWGPLYDSINNLGLLVLQCFAQVLLISQSLKIENSGSDKQPSPSLEENLEKIEDILNGLSGAVKLLHTVLEQGLSSLDAEEREAYRWLSGKL